MDCAIVEESTLKRSSNMRSTGLLPRACVALMLMMTGMQLAAADDRFDGVVDDFVLDSLALSPSYATQQGYHSHHGISLDDQLDDFSPAGIAARRALAARTEARLAD